MIEGVILLVKVVEGHQGLPGLLPSLDLVVLVDGFPLQGSSLVPTDDNSVWVGSADHVP